MELFADVLQNRCYNKFPDFHKKISVLEFLFNKVTGLMAYNFIKKETLTWVFIKFIKKETPTPTVAASENG